MTSIIDILNRLKEVIVSGLGDFTEAEITEDMVEIDFPDTDHMPKKTMIYLQPDYEEFETLSTESDEATLSVSVFVICKRDQRANLTLKTMDYTNAIYRLVKEKFTLEGLVDYATPTNFDYYPAIAENPDIKGSELNLDIVYTIDY